MSEDKNEGEKKKGFFSRLVSGLTKSSSKISEGVTAIFTKRKIDAAAIEELEELLISADLGPAFAAGVAEALAREKVDKEATDQEIKQVLAGKLKERLAPREAAFELRGGQPDVVLLVGVNGSGKTTTMGKMAAMLKAQGRRVVLAAGDTFRAAAIEQAEVWGQRVGAEVIKTKLGADASGLAYEAHERAVAAGADALLIDTAGRLQNKEGLMAELEKIIRVLKKRDETAPHHVLLVLDATVGQNAHAQVEAFKNTADVTGLVMTKLDGTAKGGVLVALAGKYDLPIQFIGVGEGVDDLQPFSAEAFSNALTGLDAT